MHHKSHHPRPKKGRGRIKKKVRKKKEKREKRKKKKKEKRKKKKEKRKKKKEKTSKTHIFASAIGVPKNKKLTNYSKQVGYQASIRHQSMPSEKKENRKKGGGKESSSSLPSVCDPHPTVATGGHGGQRLPSLFLHFGLFAVLGRLESDADGALSECICTLALAFAFAIQLFPLALGLQRRSRRAAGPGTSSLVGRRRGHHPGVGPGLSPFYPTS